MYIFRFLEEKGDIRKYVISWIQNIQLRKPECRGSSCPMKTSFISSFLIHHISFPAKWWCHGVAGPRQRGWQCSSWAQFETLCQSWGESRKGARAGARAAPEEPSCCLGNQTRTGSSPRSPTPNPSHLITTLSLSLFSLLPFPPSFWCRVWGK